MAVSRFVMAQVKVVVQQLAVPGFWRKIAHHNFLLWEAHFFI
jgi:hypothetical protein